MINIYSIQYDLFTCITKYMNFKDILNLSIVSQYFYNNILDDIFFYNLAVYYYSSDFWKSANSRSPTFSKPLKNYKLELIRIENFQDHLEKYNIRRWSTYNFYLYWNFQEIYQ